MCQLKESAVLIIEELNKAVGDAYMAGGGLPAPTDDSVKNTVLAPIEMQAFMNMAGGGRQAEDGKTYTADHLPILETPTVYLKCVWVFIPVPWVVGNVGVKKFQYDIWGDTVNTASRVESKGEVGKVNISHSTYELLKNDPQLLFESRGEIEAKGKGKIDMWFVSKRV